MVDVYESGSADLPLSKSVSMPPYSALSHLSQETMVDFIIQYTHIPRGVKIRKMGWCMENRWLHPFLFLYVWMNLTQQHSVFHVRHLLEQGHRIETLFETATVDPLVVYFPHTESRAKETGSILVSSVAHEFYNPFLHSHRYLDVSSVLTEPHLEMWSPIRHLRTKHLYLSQLALLIHHWVDGRLSSKDPNESLYRWDADEYQDLWSVVHRLWTLERTMGVQSRTIRDSWMHFCTWTNSNLGELMSEIVTIPGVFSPDPMRYQYIQLLFELSRHLWKRSQRRSCPFLPCIQEDSDASDTRVEASLRTTDSNSDPE